MFSETDRMRLRTDLIAAADHDPQITAAALVGSAARDGEDRWSDIDLALRLVPGAQPLEVAEAWTARMNNAHDAVAHLDVWSGRTLYRVFLLRSTLQVDLSFFPAADFAPLGGPFRLLFGAAEPAAATEVEDPTTAIGMAWLHALHARSSIARGRAHQALHMLNGMREHITTITCLRAGVPAHQGRGVDDLSSVALAQLSGTLVRSLDHTELARAFEQLTHLLITETTAIAPDRAVDLAAVLGELVRTATLPES